MDTDELSLVEDEYDDGVVCFGPVTESQLHRFKRLPRRTVLPSDFVLSQSLFEQDEDKKNDQSTVLDENTSTCVDNSINITHSTKNVDQEKKEIEATELKQSFSEDSNSKFSSPCFSKCIPNAKLMDTEIINRYIRMGSTSSNDSSLSEDQNKSTFEDETVSFTDAQEMESIQDNCVFDETSTCEHFSVSSAIEQSPSINQPNVLDDSNNVCTLIHCSQKDDTDLSICSDSELGDVTEDSIVADEYSVTPGKQRLFDLRVTKQSLRAKALVASAPFMDRIEETTTPVVPKVLNSPLILNNISCRHSEINENLNVLSITEIPHGTSIENFNQTSNENVFETSKFIDATAGELLISSDLKSDIVSVNKSADTMFDETMNTNKHSTDGKGMNVNKSLIKTDQIENTLNDMVRTSDNEPSMNIMSNITIPTDLNVHYDKEYLIAAQLNSIATDTSVDDKTFDETMKTNKLSTNNQSTDSNKSLNETNIENTLNVTEHKFDGEKSMNIMSNIANSISGVDEYNDGENSIASHVDIISVSTSVVDKIFDETVCTNKLSSNNQCMDMNNSLNETNIENTSNVIEHQFDGEKSMNIMSNMAIPPFDFNNEELSVAIEVDIKSTNTSCVDKELNKTVCTNGHSINNQSTDSNKSLNETNIENTSIVTEHKFDCEKSMNIRSNMALPISDVNDEEFSVAMEVDIKSTNTSCVDKELYKTLCTNRLSTNNQSMDINKFLNETNIENTSVVTEHKFDGEKPMNIMSNKANPLSSANEYNDGENSIASDVDIISISTSEVDKIFDETVCTNKLSTNNQSMDMDNSLNETNIENTSVVTEHKFDCEKSMNIRSNMALPISDVNDEEFSVAMEVDIKSTNTSCVDKELYKTLCTNRLSTNNQSMDINKFLNETNIENTSVVTEHKFDGEKSMNIMSNKANPLSSANEYNDGENSIASDVDIISISTSVVDKIFDETVCTNKLSTNNQSMDMDNSLNETNIENTSVVTEHKFDCEKSMNIRSNMALPISDVNDEEFSVAMEVDIKSTNTSCVDKELNKTVFTNGHSINNQSTDSNKSLNETNIENTLNVTEHKSDGEKSINIMSNKANPLSSADEYNDGENSIASDVDIISISTSEVDKIFVETVCTNILSTNNQSMDVNKSLNETNIENTLNVTEHQFDGEKSTNIMSNLAIPLPGVNDYIDKENSIATKVEIKSINTSIVDKIFDESMLINANKLLTDSRIMNCNKSYETESTLNNTEHRFVNNNQNTSVSAVHFDEKLHLSKLDKSILKSTVNSDNSFVEINKVNITCNTSLEDPSCMMRQYLDFELAVNEMCNDISSASGPVEKSNKPKESYDDETLENLIEQTLSSDTFNLTKVNENVSNYDGSNLSVIIENKSLETSCNNIEPNEDFVSPNNDVPITLESESIVKEVNDIALLNKSTVLNTVATPSKSEVGLAYGTDVNIQIKAKESISIDCTITDSGLVENINETKHNESSMFSDELSKLELDTFTKINKNLNNITTKQIFISEDVNEIHSTQNTLDENNLHLIADQINITDIPNSTAFELIPETEITKKNLIDQDELLNNDNQQQDLLDSTKCIDNSLEEFTNLEQMFNFGDNAKGKQVEYKTPKTQKLLDFSIIQQTPTFDNPAKKQKLLNFSIVDQTPILQSTQQKYPIENVINDESLINFSSVDQMWNSEVVTKDEINFKDLQNSSNYSSSNNLSTISAPDLELLADESIKRNTSNFSNSSFDQTITDSNLNLSTYSCAINKTQNGIIELNNLEPLLVINRQIVADEPSDSLNQTIEQNESRQKTFYDKHCVAEASTKVVKPNLKLLSKSTSNKNIDSAEFKDDSNQEPCLNPNERAIVDFSIIDQGMLENVGSKNNTDITSFESDRNVSNLIEVSFVTKSDKPTIISSENPIIPITSHSRAEKSIQSNSDEMNSTALHLEESTFLHNNTELLTDIQMNDESLFIESPEKSSIIDSFHSIELDHVQEDNKRKMETTQEYDNNEKKMKVETELKTPMSMLYKIKNMFRSSERQPSCVNNTKENSLKSNKCYQKLNFNKFEENNEDFTKQKTLKKPEFIVKSKIPCKVTDRSLTKNDEFNSSSLSSLNDSIKQKKTIPKFSGVPVLSDVSNSSNRKCAESRIPSKFQK